MSVLDLAHELRHVSRSLASCAVLARQHEHRGNLLFELTDLAHKLLRRAKLLTVKLIGAVQIEHGPLLLVDGIDKVQVLSGWLPDGLQHPLAGEMGQLLHGQSAVVQIARLVFCKLAQ